jgi:hypothetical protein
VQFHVKLASALFVIWGGLTILIGLSTLALGVGAAALMSSSGTNQLVAGLTAAAFMTLGFVAILWGGVHVGVGMLVGRLRPRARLAALMLSAVDMLLLPYGTALGCYALWVLLSEDGRKQFA